MNLFGGSSTKQRPDSEPRSLGDHGSVFRFLGSQLEGKILRGPMCQLVALLFSPLFVLYVIRCLINNGHALPSHAIESK